MLVLFHLIHFHISYSRIVTYVALMDMPVSSILCCQAWPIMYFESGVWVTVPVVDVKKTHAYEAGVFTDIYTY